MDLRIGIADSTQIIEVDMGDETDREAMRELVHAVLSGTTPVFSVVDRKGKELNVAAPRVAWIELGSEADDRRIGFGA